MSEKVVIIKFKGDSKDVEASVNRLQKALHNLNQEAVGGGKGSLPFGIDEKALSEYKQVAEQLRKINLANSQANNSSSKTNEFRQQAEELKKTDSAARLATKTLEKYDNQLAKLGGYDSELRRLNKTLSQEGVGAKVDETTKALLRQKAALIDEQREAQKLTKDLEKAQRETARKSASRIDNASSLGNGMQNTGATLTVAITAPLVLAGKSILELGTKYEENLNVLKETSKATAAEMEQISKKAMDLGADLDLPATSAADAAEAMLELAKGGLTAQQAMEAARGTLQLATAASIDGAKAAEIQANALNAFGLQASEAGRIADLLAATANASSVEITDIAESLQQASATFAAAKVPIEDVTAAIGLLGNAGLKGSDAGTSLKTFLSSLISPRNADAVETMKKLGVSVFDLQGKFVGMPSIIKQFQDGLQGLTDAQKQQYLYTIFGSDATRAANILFKTNSDTVNAATDAWDAMSLAVQRSNAAADLAKARTQGLGGAWKAFKSQLETIGLVIYLSIKEPLTNILIAVAQFAGQFLNVFQNLPKGIQQFIIGLVALAAAVGPVLAVVGTLIVALSSVAGGLTALTGAATVGAALSTLAPIIATIVVALAGLAAGVIAAIGVVYGLAEAWQNGFGPVASVVAIAVGAILTAFVPILGLPILIGAMLATLYGIWETNFAGLRDTAIQVWNSIITTVNSAMTEITAFVNEQGGLVVAWWKENYPLIQQTVQTVSEAIKKYVQSFLTAISGFWQAHGEQIKAIVSAVWSIIKTVVSTGLQVILGIIKITMQVINGDWAGAWEIFKGVVAKIPPAIGSILSGMNQIVWNALKFIVTAIMNFNGSVLNAALQLGRNLMQGIINGISWGVDKVRTKIGEVVEMVKSLPAVGWIMKSPSRLFASYGQFLMEGLAIGIEANSSKVSASLKKSVIERVKGIKKELGETLLGNSSLLQTDEGEFQQKFDLLQAQTAKTKLEELIKLRVELGVNFNKPLPNSFGAILNELKDLDARKAGLEETVKLFGEFDEVLGTKLPQDATFLEKVNTLLADPKRSAGIDDTTKAMLLLSAVAADMAENTAKINKEFDTLSKQNTDKIKDLKKQLLTFGVDDPVKRREIEMSFEDISQFSPEQQAQIQDQRGTELAQIGELNDMKKRAEAVKSYQDTLKSLNETLRGNIELTQRQKIENEILTGSLKNLTDEEKNHLLALADKIDLEKQLAPLREKIKKYGDEFGSIFGKFFASGFKLKDFKELGANLKNWLTNIWQDIMGGISQTISNAVKSLFSKLLGGALGGQSVGTSQGSGGGNILNTIFGGLGKLFGIGGNSATKSGGGVGVYTTPPFVGNNFSSGSSNQFAGSISRITEQFAPILTRERTVALESAVTNSTTTSATHEALHSTVGNLATGKFSFGNLGKSLGAMAPMLGMSLGGSLGGQSALGSILGQVGGLGAGLLGGIATGALNAGTMLGGVFGAGGALSIGGMSAAMSATVVLAPIAGALLVGAWLLGRNKQRRKDETTRNQAMLDAFSQLDSILSQINQDKLDGQSGLAQANSIREQYMSSMSQLKDKKTRNIALKDVSRIDGKIDLIRQAASSQDTRKNIAEKWIPAYSSGTFMDAGFIKQYGEFKRRNGLLPGTWTGKDYLPSFLADREMVLNPMQQANVIRNAGGVDVFANADIPNYQPKANVSMPNFATGVNLNYSSSANLSGSNSNNAEPLAIYVDELVIDIDAEKLFLKGARTNKGQKVIFAQTKSVLNKKG